MLGNSILQFCRDRSDTFAAFNVAEGPPPVICRIGSIIAGDCTDSYGDSVATKHGYCGLDRTCAPYPMNVKASPDGTPFDGKFSVSLGSLFRAMGVTVGVTDLLSCMIPTSNPSLGSPAHIQNSPCMLPKPLSMICRYKHSTLVDVNSGQNGEGFARPRPQDFGNIGRII